jgi:hypothetical protein
MRIDTVEETHPKLRALFKRYDKAPIRIRELQRRHGLGKDLILECVKTYPKIYGIELVKPAHGGSESMFIFLRKYKPKNFKS